ncbi:MAG: prephenate dehydratase [Magnetococcales bacterium]|nr:prephenate dehydratase [Magnetococcales bacterium]
MVDKLVAFQGVRGAYSEQACRERLPDYQVVPHRSFEEVFQAVDEGQCQLGMVPVENSMAGAVGDSNDLLAIHNLHIVGEYYLRVRHCLLGVPGSDSTTIQTVISHPQALAQCASYIRTHGWQRVSYYDTAGSAQEVSQQGDASMAAIASALSAELYKLDILDRDIQDSRQNTTRFVMIAREPLPRCEANACKTSLLFEVRDIPAALYKCLGGFATNGINLTRLESRPAPGKPWAYHFYLDFQGRSDDTRGRLALEELAFFTTSIKILGCYPEARKPVE